MKKRNPDIVLNVLAKDIENSEYTSHSDCAIARTYTRRTKIACSCDNKFLHTHFNAYEIDKNDEMIIRSMYGFADKSRSYADVEENLIVTKPANTKVRLYRYQ